MRARWARWIDLLRTGFWFVPMVMLGLAFGLALLLLNVDHRFDPGIRDSLSGWAYSGGPEGARTLLSTIAGSMITASTVTFSLAAVALSIASQQYGSRVLRNFMRDRTTQVLLGIFVSTFIYSVIVGRAVRGSDPTGGFVPAISVSVAIALVVVALVLLIYFIHHISASIQAAQIIRVIAEDLEDGIPGSYEPHAADLTGETMNFDGLGQSGEMSISSQRSGYLQTVEWDAILSLAESQNLGIELLVKPGDHLTPGQKLALIWGTNQLETKVMDRLHKSFILGRERTPVEDIRFPFQQLTEVVIRALSPGINDPFTAINGIDELESAMVLLGRQTHAPDRRKDTQGRLRIIMPRPTVSEILEETVRHIAIYGAKDRFVMAGLRRVLDAAARAPHDDWTEATLRRLANELDHRERAQASA